MSREAAYEANPVVGTRGGKEITLQQVVDTQGWDAPGILGEQVRELARQIEPQEQEVEEPTTVDSTPEPVLHSEEVVLPAAERPRRRRKAAGELAD